MMLIPAAAPIFVLVSRTHEERGESEGEDEEPIAWPRTEA